MNIKRPAAIIAAVILLSAYGCGNSDAGKTGAADEGKVSTAEEASVQGESSEELLIFEQSRDMTKYEFSLDNQKPYNSVEEFLESDSAKQTLKKLEGPDEQGIMITRIYAEKSTCLVFERKISKDLNMWLEEDFEKNIAKTIDSNKETFSALVDDLESCINRKNITVAVRYLDPEGKLLYERIFDNDDISSAQQSKPAQQNSSQKSETSQQSSGQKSETSQQNSSQKSETSQQSSGQQSKTSS